MYPFPHAFTVADSVPLAGVAKPCGFTSWGRGAPTTSVACPGPYDHVDYQGHCRGDAYWRKAKLAVRGPQHESTPEYGQRRDMQAVCEPRAIQIDRPFVSCSHDARVK